jgi:hypothetical protein
MPVTIRFGPPTVDLASAQQGDSTQSSSVPFGHSALPSGLAPPGGTWKLLERLGVLRTFNFSHTFPLPLRCDFSLAVRLCGCVLKCNHLFSRHMVWYIFFRFRQPSSFPACVTPSNRPLASPSGCRKCSDASIRSGDIEPNFPRTRSVGGSGDTAPKTAAATATAGRGHRKHHQHCANRACRCPVGVSLAAHAPDNKGRSTPTTDEV